MSLQSKQGLRTKLASKEYRDAFVASRIAQTIAFQARLLRQRKDLSQAELAKELGTSQNAISRLENPKYGKPSISTLRKIAAFFDVGLVVRFAPLSEIVDWTTNLSEMAVDVPGFEDDTGFVDRKPPASEAQGEMATGSTVFGNLFPLAIGQGLTRGNGTSDAVYLKDQDALNNGLPMIPSGRETGVGANEVKSCQTIWS